VGLPGIGNLEVEDRVAATGFTAAGAEHQPDPADVEEAHARHFEQQFQPERVAIEGGCPRQLRDAERNLRDTVYQAHGWLLSLPARMRYD